MPDSRIRMQIDAMDCNPEASKRNEARQGAAERIERPASTVSSKFHTNFSG